MAKYHINQNTGRPNICRAQEGNCPLKTEDGNQAPHYDSKEAARAGYEKQQEEAGNNFNSLKKDNNEKKTVTKNEIHKKDENTETNYENMNGVALRRLLRENKKNRSEMTKKLKEIAEKYEAMGKPDNCHDDPAMQDLKEKYWKIVSDVNKIETALKTVEAKERKAMESRPYREQLINAGTIKVGDRVVWQNFVDDVGWVKEESAPVKKVSGSVDLNYRETVTIEFEDGRTSVYSPVSPITVSTQREPKPSMSREEITKNVRAASRMMRNEGSLDNKTFDNLITSLNDPNIDGMTAARAKRISEMLTDNNFHKESMYVDGAIGRYKIGSGKPLDFGEAYGVLFDERSSDDDFRKAVEGYPNAYESLKRNVEHFSGRNDDRGYPESKLRKHLF